MLLNILSFLPLFLYIHSEICASYYKCLDSSLARNDDICQIKYTDEKDLTTFAVRPCKEGYKCNAVANTPFSYCQKIFAPYPLGNKCVHDKECVSSICTEGKCVSKALNETCASYLDCPYNSYCDKKCLRVKNAGDNCTSNDQCPFGYLCGHSSNVTSAQKKCLMMYTLQRGEYSTDAKLCESGKVSGGRCYDTYRASEDSPIKCKINDECVKVTLFGDKNGTENSECNCTLLGENYCDYTTMSEEWKEFVKVAKKEIENNKDKEMYVPPTRNSPFLLNEKILKAYRKTLVINYNADDCIINSLSSDNINISMLLLLLFAIVVYM